MKSKICKCCLLRVQFCSCIRCQFCGESSRFGAWRKTKDRCPKCGRQYDAVLAQDCETE